MSRCLLCCILFCLSNRGLCWNHLLLFSNVRFWTFWYTSPDLCAIFSFFCMLSCRPASCWSLDSRQTHSGAVARECVVSVAAHYVLCCSRLFSSGGIGTAAAAAVIMRFSKGGCCEALRVPKHTHMHALKLFKLPNRKEAWLQETEAITPFDPVSLPGLSASCGGLKAEM